MWSVPGAGTVRVFGGDHVHAPPGRALARDGGTWMRSAALEGTLLLTYETADEAFSPEAIRWRLTMVSGFPGQEPEFVGAVGVAQRLKVPFVFKQPIARWNGLTILIKKGITQFDINNAQYMVQVPLQLLGLVVLHPLELGLLYQIGLHQILIRYHLEQSAFGSSRTTHLSLVL